ncbi:hypothetical protein [Pedosphaera parvula]|uniref:Uncharacterized protein n=1 Tax=Pedosphaera parvula (strain Ellin514) TaxID=320771 RepID=B9XER2_PEDPL|nr:hypothetical protein [Pedosphaera parvula]EEF61776.1 hypothetical protein Cflav_PD4816 [Pedosphaera parvula Ellin514]
MDFEAYLVDWKEATKRAKEEPALGEMLGEAAYNKEKWIQLLNWFPGSENWYFECAEAWEAIRGAEGVPAEVDAKAREFMDHLITYSDYCHDLPAESVFLSISPESAARFAALADDVDFTLYRDMFDSQACEDVRETLAEVLQIEDVERTFEKGFLPYIKHFNRALGLAAKKQKGLLVQLF